MEYRFDHTIHGPVVVGEDEIIHFHQHGQLQDYVDEDPDFVNKAKKYIEDTMNNMNEMAVASLYSDVPGQEYYRSYGFYLQAIDNILEFEQRVRELLEMRANEQARFNQ